MFDFPGTGPNEMRLKAGDVVEVTERGPSGGWCKGLTGAFPTDYVEFILDSQVPAVSTIHAATTNRTSLNDISSAFDDLTFAATPGAGAGLLPSTAAKPVISTMKPVAAAKPAGSAVTATPATGKTMARFIYDDDDDLLSTPVAPAAAPQTAFSPSGGAALPHAPGPTKAPKPGPKPPKPTETVNSMDSLFAHAGGRAAGSAPSTAASTDPFARLAAR
jgi:hypothetical protein